MTQDALYAMRHGSDSLAQRAYDARLYRYGSQFAARSPAIDAGSDDAYGYDTTSTHPKVIDMGQPDIGYHYYRRVADDDPVDDPRTAETEPSNQQVEISFRQPKMEDPGDYRVSNRFDGDIALIDNYLADNSLVKGKEVVLIPMSNQFKYGSQQILVETIVGSKSSTPTEINLIVDPFAPEVEVR